MRTNILTLFYYIRNGFWAQLREERNKNHWITVYRLFSKCPLDTIPRSRNVILQDSCFTYAVSYVFLSYLANIPTKELESAGSPIRTRPDPKFSDLCNASAYVSHWNGWFLLVRQPKQTPPSELLNKRGSMWLVTWHRKIRGHEHWQFQ